MDPGTTHGESGYCIPKVICQRQGQLHHHKGCAEGETRAGVPERVKEVYMAEFQARKKRRTEDWATYGEDLTTLRVEKAYPTLQVEAQRLLALNHFLVNIDNPQLAFGVRQRAPTTLDEAVAAILELETYLKPRPTTMGSVETFDPIADDVIAAIRRSGSGEGLSRT